MKDNGKYLEEFVNDIPFDAPDDKHRDELKKQLLNAFHKHRFQPTVHTVNVWRIIMRSRISKLAAAAVIILVVLAGLPFVGKKEQGVVLANVLDRVEQAKAFMYKLKISTTRDITTGIPGDHEVAVTVSTEYGIKWEMDVIDPNTGEKMTQLLYILPDQKMGVGLMPDRKQYMRMELDDDWLVRMKKQNNDPREVIKQIMSCKYTELGSSVIDGVEVVGFQTTDPAYFGDTAKDRVFTLWVDAETWLPVRSERYVKINEQMHLQEVTYDYQWNIPVYADEFEPIIPEDYTASLTDGLKMPGISQEDAIEGLRLFAEITGRFPKSLNHSELTQEIAECYKSSEYFRNELRQLKEQTSQTDLMTKEEFRDVAVKKMSFITYSLPSPGLFYMMLMKDKKQPFYYGAAVGPDDGDAVLLRWTVSDNQYRVIFGDLTTADVTTEELNELESSLLEQ
jgi:outer membrane lipoprotein-sorting protein